MPTIQVTDIKMFYRVFRDNQEFENIDATLPTLLVLHGGPGIVDHQIELEGWKGFSEQLQVVFLDQRGCGKTEDGAADLWNLTQCGQDIENFCRAIQVEHPIIAGVSWGGYVVMSYATQFPKSPTALILCNTEAKVDLDAKTKAYPIAFKALANETSQAPYNELGNDIETISRHIAQIACEYDREPTSDNFEKFVKFCVPLFSRTKFELMPPYRVNMAMREKFIGEESLEMDFRSQLREISCPVLQLAGDRDPTHPAICAKETAACFPHAQLVIFDDAGAPVYQDQQTAFKECVSVFISEVLDEKLENTHSAHSTIPGHSA